VITVTNQSLPSVVTITGTLKNCSNQPVTDGYVMIFHNNWTLYRSVNNDGTFSITFVRCSGSATTFDITGVDNATQTRGSAVSYTFTSAVINTGDIVACGVSALEWVDYILDGNNYTMSTVTNDSLYTFMSQGSPWSTMVFLNKLTPARRFDFRFNHTAGAGAFTMEDIKLHNFDTVVLVQPFSITLTGYPSVPGQFYTGTFTGQFTEPGIPSPVHTLTGSFRLRRDY
jgi:hypothetical protein